ncbi:MAG TPA: M20/M25/M40 family metallo-hydrolase [Myxococcales bacterium]|nr:M20/M25/M40 family metallo-hydrolase [Myxococcales bacterium]
MAFPALPDGAADEALALLRGLLRIDTTNPPAAGAGERPAADLCATALREAGIEAEILEAAPRRSNVVARIPGSGTDPPLLLCAHLDVVPAGDGWRHPPFAAEEEGGFLYGRGAVDMKGFAAQAVTLMRQLRRSGVRLRRDLIFAGVADEEEGCGLGSGFLVEKHPDKVRAAVALGEIGGFTIHLGGRRIYPIQIAEKGLCWLRLRAKGEMGHGSLSVPDGAVPAIGGAAAKLGEAQLPAHRSPPFESFFRELCRAIGGPARAAAWLGATPGLLRLLLSLTPDSGLRRTLLALLSNTAAPTQLWASSKRNLVPAEASAGVDGRILPGQDLDAFLGELRVVLGERVEIEVERWHPPVVTRWPHPVFEQLAGAVRAVDPEAVAIPYVIPGFTDACSWTRLGTECFGFAPVVLPKGLDFARLYHAVDERIPLEGFASGTRMLWEALGRLAAEPGI